MPHRFLTPVGAVPLPPKEKLNVVPPATIIDFIPEDQSGITRIGKVDFDVPSGYRLEAAAAMATVAHWPTWSWQWLNGSNSGICRPAFSTVT